MPKRVPRTRETGAGDSGNWFGKQNERWLGRAWVLKLVSEAAAELASFGEYFLASRFRKGEHHFLILERIEKGDVVLIIDDDDRENRP